MKNRIVFVCISLTLTLLKDPLSAVILVDHSDAQFADLAEAELKKMRMGERGLVSQSLVEQLDVSATTTTIRALTKDEETWHPNDLKGTRSHVVPLDNKVRGAERLVPTASIIYVHTNRIDPKLSTFKLGGFVYVLAEAKDLNYGSFSADFRIREKRSAFYRNAWRDSLGLPLLNISDGIATVDYQEAKKMDLLNEENKKLFPILSPAGKQFPSNSYENN